MAFAGFDSLEFPGLDVMAWLKANTNLSFVGFYLAPAPSRPTSSWMGHRAGLAAQGWGFAPVYVGQQEHGQPGTHNLTAAQGTYDGDAAKRLMQQEGFPRDSVVYLDLEQGGQISEATAAYAGAWIHEVMSDRTYIAGVYCSYTSAMSVRLLNPMARLWCWHLEGTPPGPAYPPNLPANDPRECGVAAASVWQWAQNVTLSLHGGPVGSLNVDLDCANVADPSKPFPA